MLAIDDAQHAQSMGAVEIGAEPGGRLLIEGMRAVDPDRLARQAEKVTPQHRRIIGPQRPQQHLPAPGQFDSCRCSLWMSIYIL